jgi:hypothetical protein
MITSLNNLLRTVLFLVIVGMGGWYGYSYYEGSREVTILRDEVNALRREKETLTRELKRLLTALQLHKVDHRVAQLVVLDQQVVENGQHLSTTFQFVEVDEQGHWRGAAQRFSIVGDVVYIDARVVKFADEHIEQADPFRSTSICLFRRLFGEFQTPNEGFVLDPDGSRPVAYGHGSGLSDFERDLWSKFWYFANHPEEASKIGIRAIHGEAPSIKLEKNKLYNLELRASGGLSITVKELLPTPSGRTAVREVEPGFSVTNALRKGP